MVAINSSVARVASAAYAACTAPNAASSPAANLRQQWTQPNDILSITLLLGPEIVRAAISQLSGRTVTPVAFSFGWVSYAVASLVQIYADGTILASPDYKAVVMPASGHMRESNSWLLSRVLCHENHRLDEELKNECNRDKPRDKPGPAWEPLRITMYTIDSKREAGKPTRDSVWLLGAFVILAQVLIAIVPWALHGNWGPMMVTVIGNILALVGASLPQWKQEKWAAYPLNKREQVVALSQGNGTRHVVVFRGNEGSLNLEILANATRAFRPELKTKVIMSVLAVLWVALLICVAGMNDDTWCTYRLSFSQLGANSRSSSRHRIHCTLQNIYASSASRSLSTYGIHVDESATEVICGTDVSDTLRLLDNQVSGLGMALIPIFFPGGIKADDDPENWLNKRRDYQFFQNLYGQGISKRKVVLDETRGLDTSGPV